MNTADITNTNMAFTSSEETFVVLGVLLQFLSTPEQINDEISLLRGTVPPGVVIPLHGHADPEIFYVLAGSLEVFQATGPSAGWSTVSAGQTVSIPGHVKHALRNTSSSPTTSVTVTKRELYTFFRELAQVFDPTKPPAPPTPVEMQMLFETAAKYQFWLASPEENAEVGILLG